MVNIFDDLVLLDENNNQIPVYAEGDAPQELPDEYFTVNEDYTGDQINADNITYAYLYEFTLKYYTKNAQTLYTRLIQALNLLKSKKYITSGVGYANETYHETWFSRQADIKKIEYLQEGIMGVQYRGCSRLYYAIETEAADGTVTYGTVKQLAPVKSVSRDITSDNEAVYADNVVQDRVYGANQVTRTFETVRIDPDVVAELLGDAVLTIGEMSAHMTRPDGSQRPYVAIGYALHDGDVDQPCEVVWAYHCKVNSISLSSATIDDGTGSEGQSVEVVNVAPKKAWTTTNQRNLDFCLPIDNDNANLVDTFFEQVVTPDNAATILGE